MEVHLIGLDILTCHLMEEGKVPSYMDGSPDALLPIPIGLMVNQTINITVRIMQLCTMANGMTLVFM